MSMNLEKGQRINVGLPKFTVGLGWDPNSSKGEEFDLDASVFVLGENKKVLSDKHFVYYNNLKSPDGAIEHTGDNTTGKGEGDDESIKVDLSKINPDVTEICIVVTIHKAAERHQNFGQVHNSFVRIYNPPSGEELFKYELDENFSVETAVEFGRIYKRNGEWKFEAIGAGQKEGLQYFVDKYGNNCLKNIKERINLEKITLEKQGDSHKINLKKKDGNSSIIINLNWSKGLKKGEGSEVDLDLGCFYELKNGLKTVIDGLQFSHDRGGPRNIWTRQGCYTEAPWVWHTGDDRGATGSGENILVNPLGAGELKRITVYCLIYDRGVKWADTNAVATIKVPGNPDIIVEMGKQNSSRTFCAIAEILFGNDSLTVKKLISFHDGHSDCDKAYKWGMTWRTGSK
jgi:stress response protein SCP2